ncbi:NAD-dependent protein deacylase [Halobacillus sp. Marseille-Q1614]|uniref:NAD-dependent protein deacylase n=1 Tax=Halobacillus sp. Marseille-Q1614 TaxID=2709134 RepID=UPI00156F4B09|nr:NAD-dependent protein deacylase [Halobacillus sp. Marseille-Q1614]
MQLKNVAKQIENAEHIVVLTGAGVSTASGIPDFRSSEGVWTEDRSREEYMSNHYFSANPEDFWKKYKDIFRIKLLQQYEPNEVHKFIQELEAVKKKVSVITQNVDGLHEKAGSSSIIEYHGSLDKADCPSCGRSYDIEYVLQHEVPSCIDCSSPIKPNVVLFGDLITEHDAAEAAIDRAELLLVLGTSLQVTPFNFLPEYAVSRDIYSVLINNEPTIKDYLFDEVILGDLSAVVKDLKSRIAR